MFYAFYALPVLEPTNIFMTSSAAYALDNALNIQLLYCRHIKRCIHLHLRLPFNNNI